MQSICQDDSAFCYIHKAFPLLFIQPFLDSKWCLVITFPNCIFDPMEY